MAVETMELLGVSDADGCGETPTGYPHELEIRVVSPETVLRDAMSLACEAIGSGKRMSWEEAVSQARYRAIDTEARLAVGGTPILGSPIGYTKPW